MVIPTKNRAELLRQTLRSIDEQSTLAAEVIVADDGSTDETERVVREFGARHLHDHVATGARQLPVTPV